MTHAKEERANEPDAEQRPLTFTEEDISHSLLQNNVLPSPIEADAFDAVRGSISDTLKDLAGYDLLERKGDTYKLLVPVPFLLETNKPVRKILIFYPSALKSNAEELTEALRAFVKPKPQLFDRGLAHIKKNSLSTSCNNAMKTANNLIILYEDNAFWLEARHDLWIEYWRRLFLLCQTA